mmetsp:Transcript_6751/g.11373  ORF Transcript_6751/g.11373 Transcript_6751/m.11373 type:complete len:96 (-) Transcript_6751:303-590(-)
MILMSMPTLIQLSIRTKNVAPPQLLGKSITEFVPTLFYSILSPTSLLSYTKVLKTHRCLLSRSHHFTSIFSMYIVHLSLPLRGVLRRYFSSNARL